jgi:hypothetical protein
MSPVLAAFKDPRIHPEYMEAKSVELLRHATAFEAWRMGAKQLGTWMCYVGAKLRDIASSLRTVQHHLSRHALPLLPQAERGSGGAGHNGGTGLTSYHVQLHVHRIEDHLTHLATHLQGHEGGTGLLDTVPHYTAAITGVSEPYQEAVSVLAQFAGKAAKAHAALTRAEDASMRARRTSKTTPHSPTPHLAPSTRRVEEARLESAILHQEVGKGQLRLLGVQEGVEGEIGHFRAYQAATWTRVLHAYATTALQQEEAILADVEALLACG